jgi:hypothetical protein
MIRGRRSNMNVVRVDHQLIEPPFPVLMRAPRGQSHILGRRDPIIRDDKVAWFNYEEDPLYSKREMELVQQYLRQHGEMPGGDGLNDLF